MVQDMLHYQKFVGGFDEHISRNEPPSTLPARVSRSRNSALLKSASFSKQTRRDYNWLGVLIGWAQDVERMAVSVWCFL